MAPISEDTRRLWRPSGVAKLALLGHLAWFVIFAYAFWARQQGSLSKGGLPASDTCEKASDAISIAAELGRLDLVALSLTFLGVVLAISAVAGYFMVQHSAMKAASEEAHTRVADLAPTALMNYMKEAGHKMIAEVLQNDPSLLLKAIASARDVDQMVDGVSATDADDIANSCDGE